MSSLFQNEKRLPRLFLVWLPMVLLGGLVIGQHTEECSESSFQACKDVLRQRHELQGKGPVFTQDQIHRTCGPLLEAEDCVMHMLQNCPQFQSLPKDSADTESLQQIQKCRILIEKYVHKLGCYVGLNDTYQRCLERDRDVLQKNIENIHGGNKELQEEGCCNVRRFFDCILIPTGEQCDKDAMNIMEEFLRNSFPAVVTSVCPQYKCLVRVPDPDGQDLDARRTPGPEDDHHLQADHRDTGHNSSPDRSLVAGAAQGLLLVLLFKNCLRV